MLPIGGLPAACGCAERFAASRTSRTPRDHDECPHHRALPTPEMQHQPGGNSASGQVTSATFSSVWPGIQRWGGIPGGSDQSDCVPGNRQHQDSAWPAEKSVCRGRSGGFRCPIVENE